MGLTCRTCRWCDAQQHWAWLFRLFRLKEIHRWVCVSIFLPRQPAGSGEQQADTCWKRSYMLTRSLANCTKTSPSEQHTFLLCSEMVSLSAMSWCQCVQAEDQSCRWVWFRSSLSFWLWLFICADDGPADKDDTFQYGDPSSIPGELLSAWMTMCAQN